MDFAMYSGDRLRPWTQHEDGNWTQSVLDSAEVKNLEDVSSYSLLQRIDFDNPLLLANHDFFFTINRIQFASPVRKVQKDVLGAVNGTYE